MIVEDGQPADFKHSLMTGLPDMPKVGDYYLLGHSTFEVVSDSEGWVTMQNILHDAWNPRSCGVMSTGIYGLFEKLLKGEMTKITGIDLSLYDMSHMAMQLFPEEGDRADFKRAILSKVYNRECGMCFSRDVADSEDDLVMGCPRCAQVSYAIFNGPLP